MAYKNNLFTRLRIVWIYRFQARISLKVPKRAKQSQETTLSKLSSNYVKNVVAGTRMRETIAQWKESKGNNRSIGYTKSVIWSC